MKRHFCVYLYKAREQCREERMGDIEMQQLPLDETVDTVGDTLHAYDPRFKEHIERTVGIKDVSEIRAKRLFELDRLFNGDNFKKIMDEEDPNNNCVLHFQILQVKQPEGYDEIIEMLERDRAKASDNIWSTKRQRQLKRPGWLVYETLRQIGVRPERQDKEDGKRAGGAPTKPTDSMLSTEFQFNKETLRKNRHRLQPSDKRDAQAAQQDRG